MNRERWQKIQDIFHNAVEVAAPEQTAFLKEACGDDNNLYAEVSAMLEQDVSGRSILDCDLPELARDAIQRASSSDFLHKDFGHYRIVKLIGEGGMGVVYLAERVDLGNHVAIKILRDAWLSPARRERFASEQRTLAQLKHPAIAQLYDANTLDDGTPWFVMEYVEGSPLTEYCRNQHSSVEERLRLFRAVCEAVQYAHSQALIHRDLKPSNIMVKNDGEVRLLDFGIAKQLEALDAPIEQTMTGLRLMTPAYAAPEQVRGDRVGVQTDVYSLGVILYELLAEQLPFDLSNLSPMEAASIVAEHDPGRPSAIAKQNKSFLDIGKAEWADLDVLCLTAMRKDPRRRYQSAEALIRDIDNFSSGKPLEARPDSWNYVLGKFVQRNFRSVSAALAFFVVITALVIFFTIRLTKARNAALGEAARTQRIQHFTQNLFQGGDEAAGPADNLRVVTMLDRGVQEARTLDSEPAIQADLFETLGGIYQKLGKFDQADSLLTSALEERKRVFGADSAEAARTLIAIGLLRADQSKLEEAERLVRSGLEIETRKLPKDDPAIPRAMTALGRVLEDRGSYEAAIKLLDEAATSESKQGAPTPELASSLLELANTHFYAGHYEVAASLNQRLLIMHRQLYGDRHPLVSEDLINLGAIQQELGNYSEAEKFHRQALAIVRNYYGEDHPKTAAALTLVARAVIFQNRFDEGNSLLQPALAIRERIYGKFHPSVASTLNELGNLASKQGKYRVAEPYFRRMIDIYRSNYGEDHYLLSTAQSNLASVYLAEKQYPRAEALFREAIARYIKTLSAEHTSTGIARTKLGRVLLREQRYAEAEVESRAGYEVLSKQMTPGVSWLVNVRKDLIEEYDALNKPQEAARFRAEIERLTKK